MTDDQIKELASRCVGLMLAEDVRVALDSEAVERMTNRVAGAIQVAIASQT